MKVTDSVKVECSLKLKKCKHEYIISFRALKKNIEKNGTYICYSCKHSTSTSKRNVGNKYGKKYLLNEDYFSEPNLENCYWAGFIAADGCVWNGSTLAIKISNKDRDILERFKKDIEYTGKILEVESQNQCRVVINSSQIVDDLKKNFNITTAKSLTLLPPNIKDIEAIYSFVVGYIDGDGTICYIKRTWLKIGICGTKEFLEWVKHFFDNIVEPTRAKKSIQQKKQNKNIFEYIVYGKRARKILEVLKSVNVNKMKRKWDSI